MDFWISRSVSVSTEAVASSKISILGLERIALAIEILCFSPPESSRPEEPIRVSYPSGILMMNSCALASFAAFMTSACDASGFAYAIFSSTVPMKIYVSWDTMATLRLKDLKLKSFMSLPSISICPS